MEACHGLVSHCFPKFARKYKVRRDQAGAIPAAHVPPPPPGPAVHGLVHAPPALLDVPGAGAEADEGDRDDEGPRREQPAARAEGAETEDVNVRGLTKEEHSKSISKVLKFLSADCGWGYDVLIFRQVLEASGKLMTKQIE
eukprot:7974736-Pyramimonas_sp.AAC.1